MKRTQRRKRVKLVDSGTHAIYKDFESGVEGNSASTRISELDALRLQRNFHKVMMRFDEPQEFFNALFLFIIKLTNARGVAHFTLDEKVNLQLTHKIILSSDSKKSQTIEQKIEESAKKALGLKQVDIHRVDDWVILAVPILYQQHAKSGLACVLEVVDIEQLSPYILILQFIASHIPLIEDSFDNARLKKQVMRSASFVDLVREISMYKSFDKGIDQLLLLMKKELGCERIAIGLAKKKRARLLALSNMSKFDRRARLVGLIEKAMAEALEQQKTITHPQINTDKREIQLDLAHRSLQQETKSQEVVTSIIGDSNGSFAVWSFLWNETKVKKEDVFFIEAVSEYITPILMLLRKKTLFVKNREHSHWGRKFAFVGIFTALLYFVLMMPYDHYLSASCSLEPVATRTVSIPFDSVIEKVNYQVGDIVQKDDELVVLDGRDIRLEYFAVKEELQSTQKKMLQLLAEKKIAEYQAEMLKSQKIEKDLQLLQYHLERIRIRAPQSGVVTEGDLEKATGATVRKGEPIMEIAPLDEFFVKLEIDEWDMPFIKKGMQVEVQLHSFFEEKWKTNITYISPKIQISEQKNILVCKGKVPNAQQKLLPGMSGEARIFVGEERVWWVWLRKPIMWMKAKLWW
ncbi:efflux RND transporter periplasmic adaptor subunit [Candidatus Uabimicrobium amorphum]|uniref:Hemolysin D n=1 Tax=Uabimicrobium amorphum TaxID=2596890 RepID=A0A5S9IKY1_UABAM|nr:efflux RND transporter periplasmic adaptor subunit [Candidatus Uabimicrobium amorphum]BBM83417.1 hemolysin D [Candidatus Uabimicrobium amorphum]